jgi:ABC-2 type transport system permease protein
MKNTVRKARVLLTVWFAYMSAYRAEIIIWMLTGAVPLIMLAIWIGKARAAGGEVGGYTPQDFAAYFLAAWFSQQWIAAWVAWEIDHQIRTGTLSPKLLRPIDPMWEFAAGHFTERLVRLPFMCIVLALGIFLVPGTTITPGVVNLVAYVPCVLLAFAIRFMFAYCTGLLAFWFDQATAIDEFYYIIAAFLTGSFAPLSFYPPFVRTFIEWTPFPYLVYYPARVLTGAESGAAIVRILAAQVGWLALLLLAWTVLWRRGLRRYGAVGA